MKQRADKRRSWFRNFETKIVLFDVIDTNAMMAHCDVGKKSLGSAQTSKYTSNNVFI